MSSPAPRNALALMLPWLVLAVLVGVLDQVTKQLVLANLHRGEMIPVTGFFDLVLVYNTGAAFSFLAEHSGWQRWFFTVLALAISAWLLALTEAVNSGFNAWTKWADAHPNSSSYERYRSDNHLSWALAGLIAGATALGDDELAAYVLDGGSWTDSYEGAYQNPSSIRSVIDWAIEPDGRMYEEKILRDPPIGYSFFHLWAMMLVARVAEVHHQPPPDGVARRPENGLQHLRKTGTAAPR